MLSLMKLSSSMKTSFFLSTIMLMVAAPLVISGNNAYAQDQSGFTVLSGDLAKNPLAQKILERIEIAKQKIAEMQQKQQQINEKQQFLEEQRKIAKQRLNEELQQMNKDNAANTPKAAFTRFVEKTPEKVQDVFWGMFTIHNEKIKLAQDAMNKVLGDGGSYQEARDAYNKIAGIKRVDLIEATKNLNVNYGLADDSVQSTFDKYGKLPRYDD